MDCKTIRVVRSGEGFATLVLNRPDKLNTLSNELRREFVAAVASLQADPAVRVLVLTGAGRAFSAGMDLDEWGATDELAAGAYDNDPVRAIRAFSGPVIGAINGLAMTGGLEIALSCDLLVASTQARFADTHAHVGLLPGWGGSVRMARAIGLNRAKELALTGRYLGADEALAWGLVNHVVAPEALMAKAEEIAGQMAAAVPETLTAYKRLLDDGASLPMDEALALERRLSIENNAGADREAINARVAAMVARRKKPK
ncbi:MAG: Short chain enoyl-CoA hydratase [Variovorax sp.]|nr:Short chain enoyl-CoA hydratase [Variovorax sp.]